MKKSQTPNKSILDDEPKEQLKVQTKECYWLNGDYHVITQEGVYYVFQDAFLKEKKDD